MILRETPGVETTRCQARDVGTAAILPFLFLAFGISWTVLWLMINRAEAVESVFGELGVTNPLYGLAVWAPGLVGLALVLGYTGRAGLLRFLTRLSPRGVAPGWWVLVLFGLPVVKIASAMLNGVPLTELLVVAPFAQVLLITVFMLFLGPVEEFGWRGTLLPLLQRLIAPVWAGLAVGALWAVWHVPAFYLGGAPHTAWSIMPFLIGVTAVGVVMAVVYNRTGGNLLLAILLHWQLNIAFWPEAQPWENYLNVLLAAVLVWANRDVMTSKTRAETVVVPQ